MAVHQEGLPALKLLQTVLEQADVEYTSQLPKQGFLDVTFDTGRHHRISFGLNTTQQWVMANASDGRHTMPGLETLLGKTVNPYVFVKSYLREHPSAHIAKIDLVFKGADKRPIGVYTAPRRRALAKKKRVALARLKRPLLRHVAARLNAKAARLQSRATRLRGA